MKFYALLCRLFTPPPPPKNEPITVDSTVKNYDDLISSCNRLLQSYQNLAYKYSDLLAKYQELLSKNKDLINSCLSITERKSFSTSSVNTKEKPIQYRHISDDQGEIRIRKFK
ncbi:hypothetical protein [Treponema parvum]|uniref:hypothetical protein n=1 Tax=Treponema parvum TaxID=138851 RepID=UPI001AEC1539|nr:hypothetical protein [Treponema parvum]QTQ15445.1 hypothetical protein HXT04_01280 [Treponema parvum]